MLVTALLAFATTFSVAIATCPTSFPLAVGSICVYQSTVTKTYCAAMNDCKSRGGELLRGESNLQQIIQVRRREWLHVEAPFQWELRGGWCHLATHALLSADLSFHKWCTREMKNPQKWYLLVRCVSCGTKQRASRCCKKYTWQVTVSSW